IVRDQDDRTILTKSCSKKAGKAKQTEKQLVTGLEELKAVNQEQWHRERCFSSCHERGTKGIEPQTFGFRAPMLYHLAIETPR
ncbi:unnamed protein product, partial [Pocillopora meandrina]